MGRTVLVLLLLAAPTQLLAASPFHDPVFGFAKLSAIQYATAPINLGATSTPLLLDIYQPTDIGTPVPGGAPVLVMIHGGSFTSGNRNLDYMQLICSLYATYGYTVASIDYRLAGTFPPAEPGPAGSLPLLPLPPEGVNAINAAVSDSKKAMQWMRDNAATYNVDPNRIGIGGVSAGAITSLLEAYNNPPASVRPKVVLDFLGSMYGSENNIQAGAPPAFIVHGTADPIVPFSGDQAVANRMAAVGVYREFYAQTGLGHTFDFDLVSDGKTLRQHNIDFLANFLLVPEPSGLVLAGIAMFACMPLAIRNSLRRAARYLRR